MFSRVFSVGLAMSLWLGSAWVTAGVPVSKEVESTLRSALEVPGTGLKVGTVKTSEIPGMFEVQFVDGPLIRSEERSCRERV